MEGGDRPTPELVWDIQHPFRVWFPQAGLGCMLSPPTPPRPTDGPTRRKGSSNCLLNEGMGLPLAHFLGWRRPRFLIWQLFLFPETEFFQILA